MNNQVKIWSPEETDPTATTLTFRQIMECYPELPYFLRLGWINARQTWSYEEHLHEIDHELILVHAGRVRVWIDDCLFIAAPGDAYFVLPGQRHREEAVTPRLKFTFLNFSLWTPGGLNGRLAEQVGTPRRQRIRDTDGAIAATLGEITREVKSERHGSFEIVNAAILQLLWHVRRRMKVGRKTSSSPSGFTGVQRNIIRKACTYLQRNRTQAIPLGELARQCAISPDHLWHLFKKQEGTTPRQYALKVRMTEATRLLRETDLTSRQVAERLGFRDAAYFSRAFTRHTGFTPTIYRRHRGAALPDEIGTVRKVLQD